MSPSAFAGFSQSVPKAEVVGPWRSIWEKHQYEISETREKNTALSIYSSMFWVLKRNTRCGQEVLRTFQQSDAHGGFQ